MANTAASTMSGELWPTPKSRSFRLLTTFGIAIHSAFLSNGFMLLMIAWSQSMSVTPAPNMNTSIAGDEIDERYDGSIVPLTKSPCQSFHSGSLSDFWFCQGQCLKKYPLREPPDDGQDAHQDAYPQLMPVSERPLIAVSNLTINSPPD